MNVEQTSAPPVSIEEIARKLEIALVSIREGHTSLAESIVRQLLEAVRKK